MVAHARAHALLSSGAACYGYLQDRGWQRSRCRVPELAQLSKGLLMLAERSRLACHLTASSQFSTNTRIAPAVWELLEALVGENACKSNAPTFLAWTSTQNYAQRTLPVSVSL